MVSLIFYQKWYSLFYQHSSLPLHSPAFADLSFISIGMRIAARISIMRRRVQWKSWILPYSASKCASRYFRIAFTRSYLKSRQLNWSGGKPTKVVQHLAQAKPPVRNENVNVLKTIQKEKTCNLEICIELARIEATERCGSYLLHQYATPPWNCLTCELGQLSWHRSK